MDAKIEKKIKTACVLKKITVISVVFTLVFIILGAVTNVSGLLSVGMIGFIFSIPSCMVYIEKFMPVIKSMNYLNKYKLQETAKDLTTTFYNLPKSKICMGNNAFYSKLSGVIIPYSMILWVYIEKVKYLGVVPMEENVYFCCRDGERFTVKANRDELMILLQQIQICSPDLLIGYDNRKESLYHHYTGEFREKYKP